MGRTILQKQLSNMRATQQENQEAKGCKKEKAFKMKKEK